jgi:ubiquinone/menaquinone biosynthesis C-methylase UbiE
MVKRAEFDNGLDIDWGRTSKDYAKYRPGPPISLYKKLKSFGVGLPGQRVLDQGTGTGVFARQLARQGCKVIGTDLSETQIQYATQLANEEGLANIEFFTSSAETNPFEDHSFDIISASQCFVYFDQSKWIPEAKRLLNNDGKIVISFFHWLPLEDPISNMSEKLVLKYNPHWGAHSLTGEVKEIPDWLGDDFKQDQLISYTEDIKFSRDVWRGRIRALRAIGPTLSKTEVKKFDLEHDKMIKENFGDEFIIPHKVISRIISRK